MNKKKKILLVLIGIFLVTSILIGISYAYYIFNVSQSGSNVVRTDCFEITYSDGNAINLSETIPLSDKEARELDPYTFTINNVCNHAIDYDINIETLEGSTIDSNGVRVRIDNFKSQILGDIENNDSSVIVNNNVLSSKTVKHGSIVANGSKTYNLRMYIDEESTMEETANKTFNSKVVVSAKLNPNYKEAMLEDGYSFNRIIKTLAGDENPTPDTVNTSITAIERSLNSPSDSDNAVVVSEFGSPCPIYAWFNNGTIYIYSETEKLYTDEYSSGMFGNLESVDSLDLSYLDTSKTESMSYMFSKMKSLTNLDLSNFDTSNVESMYGMFSGLEHLENIDLSSFNTSNVTNMGRMFSSLYSLTNLDLSNFDTSNVTTMDQMFINCYFSSLDISNFNTSKVTDMSQMFQGNVNLTELDLGHFDTSNVTNMNSMLSGMRNLTFLDISSFDTSNVTNMRGMFFYDESLMNLDVSHFDTSNVTDMSAMFGLMSTLSSLDISNFYTSKVTDMSRMFYEMNNVSHIYVSEKWDISSVDTFNEMFYADNYLIGGTGTVYDSGNAYQDYAVIDCGTLRPGYLTYKGPTGDNAAYCASIGYN